MTPNVTRPRSRGRVSLASPDPADPPLIDYQWFTDADGHDERTLLAGMRMARRVAAQAPMAGWVAREVFPGPEVESDEQILDWVARDAETALHPSCTAAMGTGPMSVVDPLTMGVHGTSGLRVVDASVMPYVTNGNIYAPVMMVAEKAADIILGNTPLPPVKAPFYRHRAG